MPAAEQADRFEIEKSVNGISFVFAGALPATAGTPGQRYTFRLEQSFGTVYYYRVKVIATGAAGRYTTALAISTGKRNQAIVLRQNPVHDVVNVLLISQQRTAMFITDTRGTVMREQKDLPAGNNSLSVSTAGLPPGIYHIVLSGPGSAISKTFMKK